MAEVPGLYPAYYSLQEIIIMDEFTLTEQALIDYFNTGADLAEHVKRCVKKNQRIDNKTIIALNNFIIAAHNIADLQYELERRNMRLN